MKLYTINNNYPDRNFAFTLTATAMGFAPSSHEHVIANITGASQALAGKADLDHDHDRVITLYGATPSEGTAVVTLTAQVSSGSSPASVSLSGQTITLDYESTQTGDVLGILEVNPNSEKILVQFFSGILTAVDADNNNATFLSLEDNVNA